MKIIRAEHLGMCFGVRDAIALAKKHGTREPLTILGELVHNETVLASLRSEGIKLKHSIEEVDTPTVMITAHGASQREIERVRQRGLNVLEATCPLVHYAHRSVLNLARAGYHPVIIGKKDHVEVRGLVGDLDAYDVVLTAEDVMALQERTKFGVAAQTTQPISKVRQLVSLVRNRFPKAEVRFVDTVCHPTKQRQTAAIELARSADVVVVIGGANSNNTRELVSTCRSFCSQVHHVQNSADLNESWFRMTDTVGIAAGTSTPDETIAEVENWLRELARRIHAFDSEQMLNIQGNIAA